MQKNIIDAFPRRALTLIDPAVSKSAFSALVSGLFIFLICLGLGGGLLFQVSRLVPGIERDYVIAMDAEEFPAENIKGKCTSNVFTSCEGSFDYRDSAGTRKTSEINFSFVDFHAGDYDVSAVRSASKPDLVTLSLGIDTLWRRIFTALGLGVMGVLFVGGGVLHVRQALTTRRKIRALSGQILKPVTVKVLQQVIQNKAFAIIYSYTKDGQTKKYRAAGPEKSVFTPFFLDTPGEALAVTTPGNDYAFLLDDELTRLELTDAERKALLQAREAI